VLLFFEHAARAKNKQSFGNNGALKAPKTKSALHLAGLNRRPKNSKPHLSQDNHQKKDPLPPKEFNINTQERTPKKNLGLKL
jgi:hypothetical protein